MHIRWTYVAIFIVVFSSFNDPVTLRYFFGILLCLFLGDFPRKFGFHGDIMIWNIWGWLVVEW